MNEVWVWSGQIGTDMGKTYVLLEKPVSVPLCQTHITNRLAGDHSKASRERSTTGRSQFTSGLRSWKGHANRTQNSQCISWELRGLTNLSYIVCDYTTTGHIDRYISTIACTYLHSIHTFLYNIFISNAIKIYETHDCSIWCSSFWEDHDRFATKSNTSCFRL
jgi:hypothetical protein